MFPRLLLSSIPSQEIKPKSSSEKELGILKTNKNNEQQETRKQKKQKNIVAWLTQEQKQNRINENVGFSSTVIWSTNDQTTDGLWPFRTSFLPKASSDDLIISYLEVNFLLLQKIRNMDTHNGRVSRLCFFPRKTGNIFLIFFFKLQHFFTLTSSRGNTRITL